jgi:hypothetical protein
MHRDHGIEGVIFEGERGCIGLAAPDGAERQGAATRHRLVDHALRKVGERQVKILRQQTCRCCPEPGRSAADVEDTIARLQGQLRRNPWKPGRLGDGVLAMQSSPRGELPAVDIVSRIVCRYGGHGISPGFFMGATSRLPAEPIEGSVPGQDVTLRSGSACSHS